MDIGGVPSFVPLQPGNSLLNLFMNICRHLWWYANKDRIAGSRIGSILDNTAEQLSKMITSIYISINGIEEIQLL